MPCSPYHVPKKRDLSLERLRAIIDYNPKTGLFRWKQTRGKGRKGKIAGSKCNGKIRIKMGGVNYRAHHLAWFYVYGCWPKQQLDHINRNPYDNRITNLRYATDSENRQNSDAAKGFIFREKNNKYMALITINGKQKSVGCYCTPEEARDAYLNAKRIYHKAWACE